MKFNFYFVSFLILFFAFSSKAQTGCPSNLPSNIISGPDSLHTDADQTFRSLTINPLNPNHVLVGTEGNGIFISHDGMATWFWSRAGLKHNTDAEYAETWSATFNPSDTSNIYLGTTNSAGPTTGNYPSAEAGVYFSSNGGAEWQQYNCGLANSKASAIWCDPVDSRNLLLAIEAGTPSFGSPPQSYYTGGIFRSTDNGLNWNLTNMPSGADSCSFWKFEHHNGTIITYGLRFDAAEGRNSLGFIKSTDNGQSWQILPEPLPGRIIAEFTVSNNGTNIIAAVRDSFFVYVSTNSGNSWNKINLPVHGTVAYSPADDNIVFFASWNTLYKSTNGISSADINSSDYKKIYDFPDYIEKIAFAPSDPSIIYLAMRGYNISRSTDAGESFSTIVKLRKVMENLTGIDKNDYQSQSIPSDLSIYPNPTRGYITLETSLLKNSPAVVTVWDILGRKVFEKQFSSGNSSRVTRIALGSLAYGFYILQVRTILKTVQIKFIKH